MATFWDRWSAWERTHASAVGTWQGGTTSCPHAEVSYPDDTYWPSVRCDTCGARRYSTLDLIRSPGCASVWPFIGDDSPDAASLLMRYLAALVQRDEYGPSDLSALFGCVATLEAIQSRHPWRFVANLSSWRPAFEIRTAACHAVLADLEGPVPRDLHLAARALAQALALPMPPKRCGL